MTTNAARLAEVRKSISDVLTYGQSVRKDGRELRMADLASLRSLEKEYEQAALNEAQSARRKPRNRVYYGSI